MLKELYSRFSFIWLFYSGLLLLLLSVQPPAEIDLTPKFIATIRDTLKYCGYGLLALRLLTLIPRKPLYVLVCCSLFVFLRFSEFIAAPATLNLTKLALVVTAAYGADIRVILKLYFAYFLFFIVVYPVLFAFGVFGSVSTHAGYLQGGSFGFGNPNQFATCITPAVFLGLYLFKVKRLTVIWGVCWAAACLVFFLTLCATQAFLLLAFPLVGLILKKKTVNPYLMAALPLACLLLSVVLAWYFGPGYGSNTFESRFSIPALVYEKYGLSVLGQNCGLNTWFSEYPFRLPLDNCFLNLLICCGVIPGLLALAFLTHLYYLVGAKKDWMLSAMACCFIVAGFMEYVPIDMRFCFLPILYIPLLQEHTQFKKQEKPMFWIAAVSGIFAVAYAWLLWHPHAKLSRPYGTIDSIAAPEGFVKEQPAPKSFPEYLESLPLARPDSVLTQYDGAPSDSLQYLNYRIVDFPLIDKNEQCADVCMRLRAEYLYDNNRFWDIRFADTRGKTLQYYFGACRRLFEKYLREVFKWSNTESMRQSLPVRDVKDLSPGDVLVYDKDSRPGETYGHAVMVVAVAVDSVSRQKAVLLLEGSTPACDIHIVSNPGNPEISPWYLVDDLETRPLAVGRAIFYAEDLRCFEN